MKSTRYGSNILLSLTFFNNARDKISRIIYAILIFGRLPIFGKYKLHFPL